MIGQHLQELKLHGREVEVCPAYRRAIARLVELQAVLGGTLAAARAAPHRLHGRRVEGARAGRDLSQGDPVVLRGPRAVAGRALAQIQLNRLQAAVSLYKALGGGWSGADVSAARVAAKTPSA